MLTGLDTWKELSEKLRIHTDGQWRKSVIMRRGRRLESQVFSSSSLENVYSMGAFSIIRFGANIGAAHIGRFTAIGGGLVCSAPEHPVEAIGISSVFLKSYPWAQGGDNFYEVPLSNKTLTTRPVHIGSDVWIGRDVYIKGGVNVGHGSIIAARSVVTKDVPSYSIVAGTPARIIRMRFPDHIIDNLLELCWWNFDPSWMAEVDQSNINACVEYLVSEKSRLPPLLPRAAVFTDDGYVIQ